MKRQGWFEMKDVRSLVGAAWIPLRQSETRGGAGMPAPGWTEEFIAFATLAVCLADRAKADKLGYSDLNFDHRPAIEQGRYVPVDVREDRKGQAFGTHLVIEQCFEGAALKVWHLHPDLVVALGLAREGDSWRRPSEGWIEVARLTRGADGVPNMLEIRAEFLGDYLVARGMALYVTAYRARQEAFGSRPALDWPRDNQQLRTGRDDLHLDVIMEDENPYAGTVVTRIARTGVDAEGEAPVIDPDSDEGVTWSRGVVPASGRTIVRVAGALWRTEWFAPTGVSIRVRGDKVPAAESFAVDAAGARAQADALGEKIRWLSFKPDLVPALLDYRGSGLGWHTRDTGSVGASSTRLDFGVNATGLVNVLAMDIARLPHWELRIWSAHNVTPEGGVSAELIAAQMEVKPAATKAPESRLLSALDRLDAAVEARTGSRLLRPHADTDRLAGQVHRFRAAEREGICALAKDVTRLFAERIDVGVLAPFVTLAKGEQKLGSLKHLERTLATVMDPADARTLTGPFFGIQDLRLADAHLGGEDKAAAAMAVIGIDPDAPAAMQGAALIGSFVAALAAAAEAIDKLSAKV